MRGRDRWMLSAVGILAALGFFLQIRIAEVVPGAGFFLPYMLGVSCGIAAMFAFSGERTELVQRGRWIALGVALAPRSRSWRRCLCSGDATGVDSTCQGGSTRPNS